MVIGTYSNGIFVSNNEVLSWDQPVKNIEDTPIRAFAELNHKLFAATDKGIYQSEDKGNTWEPVFGKMQVLGFTILNNQIYAAVSDGAIMSKDYGVNWNYIYESDALHDISNDGTYVFAMTLGQGLLKSKDYGQTWENANNGISKKDFYTNEIRNIDDDLFSAQWIGIYHSNDNGNYWKLIEGLPESTAFSTLEVTNFGLLAGISIR